MSSRTPLDPASRHRLFRAMVVMGGSLAVGCGGVTTGTDTGSSGTKGSGGSGGLGSGGSGGLGDSGGTAGSGGMMDPGGAGGAAGAGGIPVETGGSAGQRLDAGSCLPAQWDCAETPPHCAYTADRWVLPENCACDPRRPATANDCAANESFVCRESAPSTDGGAPSDVVPFECSCVPKQEYCFQACQVAFGDSGGEWRCQETGTRNPRDVLCGCALILLR